MEIRTVQRPICPLCSSKGEVLYRELTDVLYKAPGKWSLNKCQSGSCGLCWLDPVVIEADLDLLYEDYSTHGVNTGELGIKSKFRSILLGIYDSVKLLPLAFLGLSAEKRQMTNMFLDGVSPGRVLDLGCGDGKFLYRMHLAGWSVTGLDFDEKAIEAAKNSYGKFGFELLCSDLFSARFPENSFDAVTMNHVIEHVLEPVVLLAEVKRILKSGGRLVSTTPNIQSLGHSIFAEYWRGLEPPRHLQIFSLPALEHCARAAGFSNVEVRSSAANADFIIGGSFAIQLARKSGNRSGGGYDISILRGVRSCLMQYREALLCRKQPDRGEEAVLICRK